MLAERRSTWLILLSSPDLLVNAPVGGNPRSTQAQAKVTQPPAFAGKRQPCNKTHQGEQGTPGTRRLNVKATKHFSCLPHKLHHNEVLCNFMQPAQCPHGRDLRAAAAPKLSVEFTFPVALFLHTCKRQEKKICWCLVLRRPEGTALLSNPRSN